MKTVSIELNYDEVDYIKGCIALVLEHKLGDKDDPTKVKLGESLKNRFLEAKGQLKSG